MSLKGDMKDACDYNTNSNSFAKRTYSRELSLKVILIIIMDITGISRLNYHLKRYP